jgi:hypothetical protein
MQSGRIRSAGKTGEVIASHVGEAYESGEGVFDLSEHPARAADHRPLIRKHTLYRTTDGGSEITQYAIRNTDLDKQLAPTTRYYPDEALVAEIEVVSSTPIKAPRLALAIEDSLGRRITTLASFFQESELGSISANTPCRMRCTLTRLNLGSGRYLVSVSVLDKYVGLLDALENVAWFDVIWRNSYGNGEPYLPVYGPVLSEAEWRRVE